MKGSMVNVKRSMVVGLCLLSMIFAGGARLGAEGVSETATMSASDYNSWSPIDDGTSGKIALIDPDTGLIAEPTFEDIVFGTVEMSSGKMDMMLDIYRPTDVVGPTPCVIYIHGGGRNYKDITTKSDQQWPTCYSLTKHGITVVSVEYRDFPTGAIQPSKIFDVKGAIRFLRAHAGEFGIDPQRFGVWGGSAGGQLSNIIALTTGVEELEGDVGGNLAYSSSVKVGVTYYGFVDFLTLVPDFNPVVQTYENSVRHDDINGALARNFGSPVDLGVIREAYENNDTNSPYWDIVELISLCNPINYVDPNDPPMFLAHGGKDVQVPYEQSFKLFEALLANDIDAWLYMSTSGTHGYVGNDVDNEAIEWMIKYL